MNTTFELKLLKSQWIKDDGKNDLNDLCSHGTLYLRIGDEILSDTNTPEWCTSVAALHLMRTLSSDYDPQNNYLAQLIPCCGHEMYYDETGSKVEIHGCPKGIDWRVVHYNTFVELITENGSSIKIDNSKYKSVVLNFVSEVETFYGNPYQKIIPDDALIKDTFELFWKEWNRLKKTTLSHE